MLARTHGDDPRVVVLAGELRDLLVPGERATGALHLVRGDLLAIAGAADDDAQRLGAVRAGGDDGLGGSDAERRVVVQRVVLERPVIDDLVPGPGQVRLERLLELEASVVSAQVDLHGGSSAVVCECQSKIGPVVRVRLSSKKPGTLAAATTPSYRRPASSPLGAGEMTGPKNATSPTATTGVPTSSPTFEIPSWCEARSCSS